MVSWFGSPFGAFAGAGTADDRHIFVPCRLRVLGTAVHGQPICGDEDDIVLKIRVDKGLDIRRRPPAGGTVLCILPKLFGIFPFEIDGKAKEVENKCMIFWKK